MTLDEALNQSPTTQARRSYDDPAGMLVTVTCQGFRNRETGVLTGRVFQASSVPQAVPGVDAIVVPGARPALKEEYRGFADWTPLGVATTASAPPPLCTNCMTEGAFRPAICTRCYVKGCNFCVKGGLCIACQQGG